MRKQLKIINEFVMITFATAIVAAAVFFFLMPSHLAVGSISGLSIVIGNFIPLPISTITMIFNVSLLVIGFLLIGREFGGKTIYTSVLLPIIIGIFEIKIPGMIDSILVKSSSCMAPVSMLLTGIVISEYKVKELINDKSVYITVLFRLIIIPVIVGLAVKMIAGEDIARFAVIFYAMPCGLNTVVFPKMVGEDCKIGAGFAFISNIGACFTIPLVFGLFGIAV